MRVEDLARIQQGQITNNTILYVSNNGAPFSAGIIDIASQVSGVTGTYVVNSQLSGTSGALVTQIAGVSGYVNNNTVLLTGNQIISGNKSFNSSLVDTTNTGSINLNTRTLFAVQPGFGVQGVLNWGNRIMSDTAGNRSLDWTGRYLYDNTPFPTISIDWQNRILSGNWIGQSFLIDSISSLTNSDSSINIQNQQLIEPTTPSTSLDWGLQRLIGLNDGSTTLDWNNKILTGNWTLNGTGIATSPNLQATGQRNYNLIIGLSGLIAPNNLVYNTGNQTVSGNKTFINNLNYSTASGTTLYTSTIKNRNVNFTAIDIGAQSITDLLVSPGTPTIDWGNRVLFDINSIGSVDWKNRILSDDSQVGFSSIDWNGRRLFNSNGNITIDYQNCKLWLDDGNNPVDWGAQTLTDDNNQLSVNWGTRQLFDNKFDNNPELSLDWINRMFTGGWVADDLTIDNISMREGVHIIKTPKINFKITGAYSVFTVPTNCLFSIDTMEVITSDIISPSAAPFVKYGNSSNGSAYQTVTQTTSNTTLSRHIFNNPQDAVDVGTTLVAIINTASTATSHSGYLLFKGYLLKK